ncbi:MAG: hypothetical protein ACR2JD_06235 [Nocardioides sp.]
MKVVYSEERTRVLKFTLRAVQGLALGMAVVAVWVLVRAFTDASDSAREATILYATVLALQAGVLVTVARWSIRRLPERGTDARTWCLTTGGLTLFSAVPLLTNILGIVVIFVGIFLVSLALRTDRAEPSAAGGVGQ